MRKKSFLLLALCGLIILTGCGKSNSNEDVNSTNIITCTLSSSEDDYTLTATYKAYVNKKDVVTKVTTEEVVTSDSSSILEYFDKYLNQTYTAANEEYGGYQFNVTKEENKVISNVTIDYNAMDMEKYADDLGENDFLNKDNHFTKDSIVSFYELIGATCDNSK